MIQSSLMFCEEDAAWQIEYITQKLNTLHPRKSGRSENIKHKYEEFIFPISNGTIRPIEQSYKDCTHDDWDINSLRSSLSELLHTFSSKSEFRRARDMLYQAQKWTNKRIQNYYDSKYSSDWKIEYAADNDFYLVTENTNDGVIVDDVDSTEVLAALTIEDDYMMTKI